MKLAFLGTPEVAAGTLRALVAAGHDVVVVVSRARHPQGARTGAQPEPGQGGGRRARVARCRTSRQRSSAIGPELGVVVAYGRLIKPDVLAEVPMVNVHFSLLPRWRGAAPVERAILAGDAETGRVLDGVGGGPRHRAGIRPCDHSDRRGRDGRRAPATPGRPRERSCSCSSLSRAWGRRCPKSASPRMPPRSSRPSCISTSRLPAEVVNRTVRVGRAWTHLQSKALAGPKARVLPDDKDLSPGQIQGNKVGTGQGALELLVVQPEGKAGDGRRRLGQGRVRSPDERLGR